MENDQKHAETRELVRGETFLTFFQLKADAVPLRIIL